MNQAQRHVIVIAIGVLCVIAARGLTAWVINDSQGGWFMYAPDSTEPIVPSITGRSLGRELVIWIGALVVWVVSSLRIYGDRADS